MIRLHSVRLPYDHPDDALAREAARLLGVDTERIVDLKVRRRGIDARGKRRVVLEYILDIALAHGEAEALERLAGDSRIGPACDTPYCFPSARRHSALRPVVVGAGPCGLFAALALAEAGWAPLVLERGKPARQRARDVERFWRRGELDGESNVAFGEGGAGTFSDGKLTTQIRDREGRCRKVLETLVACGAPEDILWDSHPHVGTDVLVEVVGRLTGRIEALGGSVRFGARVDDAVCEQGRLQGFVLADGEQVAARCAIVAIGYSARDTVRALHTRGLAMAAKPFAIGLRIEHPQAWIDRVQYGPCANHARLGAAPYRLTWRSPQGRAVYTFCMCPGGAVVAAATAPGQVVTNGMSTRARDGRNGNSALLAAVGVEDFEALPQASKSPEALRGLAFQAYWERLAWDLGGGGFRAPVQQLGDFLANRASTGSGGVLATYRPGVTPSDLAQCLPEAVTQALRGAIRAFDRRMKGFARPDAMLTGVETRSSSAVRMLRDSATLESNGIEGLIPAGEGAGHAGGIMSSAVEGLRAAEALAARATRG